jgi:hypothetical protein
MEQAGHGQRRARSALSIGDCGERDMPLGGRLGLVPQEADQGDGVGAWNEAADGGGVAGVQERAHAAFWHAGRTGNFINRKDFVVG